MTITANDYPFLTASLVSAPPTNKGKNLTLLQEFADRNFDNSTDVWTIEEEYPFASEQYREIPVLIKHVINSATGEKRGDDYRHLLFKDLQHDTLPGWYYKFADNVWIAYSTDKITSASADTYVQRCNNTLRWLGEDGGLYEVPCAITEIIKQTRDYSTAGSSFVIPAGFTDVLVQFNEKTNKIKANQRFLLGNKDHWFCFRVHGAGVQNYKNLKTYDNMSSGIIGIIVGANFVNEQTDDLIRGVCDVNKSIYSVHINNQDVIGNVGRKIQLIPTVKLNNETVNLNVMWSTDNEQVAKIDANGLLTMIGVGGCEVLCSLKNNLAVFDTIIINVSGSPVLDYEIVVTPNMNWILKGDTQIFDVRLWLNNVLQSDTFTFTLNPNAVPLNCYTYIALTGNTFSITNKKMFLTDNLEITCMSGSHSKIIKVLLKASF